MNEARAIARCEEAAALLPPRFRRAALQMPTIASDTRRSSVCVPDSPRRTAARGRGHAAVLRRGQPRDAARSRADGGRGDGLLALCLRGDAAAGISVPARRLPLGGMRNGGAAERRGREPAGYFLAPLRIVTERSAWPSRRQTACSAREPSGARSCSPPGGGKTTLLRDLIRTLVRKRDRAALRVAVVDERGEIAVCAGGEAQMALGDAHGRAHALPQGAGHRHGAAGNEPAGHRGR